MRKYKMTKKNLSAEKKCQGNKNVRMKHFSLVFNKFFECKEKKLALYSKLIHYKVQIKCTFDIKLPFGLDLIYFGIEKNVKNFFVGNLIHICGLNMLYIYSSFPMYLSK